MCHSTHVEVREQRSEAGSFLPPCGALEPKWDHQLWWQTPLSTEPSHCLTCIASTVFLMAE